MPFGRSAALSARSAGVYPHRLLRIENHGDATATQITVTFTGQGGVFELLAEPVPDLVPGAVVEIPVKPFRRGAVFKTALRWVADNGAPGEFFGLLTTGR